MARKRLGELLLERGTISREQLDQALSYQRQTGHRLGTAMVVLGFLSEVQLCVALGQALGLKAVRLPPEPEQLDRSALRALQARFCEANDLFPLAIDSSNPNRKALVVAMADPLNLPAIEEIEFVTGMKVVPVIAPLSGVRTAVRRYYLKQPPEAPGPQREPDQMTIIRAGGSEAVISTATRPVPLPRPPAAEEGAGVGRDVTERTALADLISDRIERRQRRPQRGSIDADLDYLLGAADSTTEAVEKLESRFWALLRIMAKKGLISRDEFLEELADKEE